MGEDARGGHPLVLIELHYQTDRLQGKGKGNPEYWIARIKPGRVMFELDGVPEAVARRAFELAAAKLPILTKFVTRGLKI